MTHEIGHMLGMRHCIYYQCGMKGANHIQETDDSPLHFCPICYRKLHHFLNFNILDRFTAMVNVCTELEGYFLKERDYYNKRIERLNSSLNSLKLGAK